MNLTVKVGGYYAWDGMIYPTNYFKILRREPNGMYIIYNKDTLRPEEISKNWIRELPGVRRISKLRGILELGI